MLHRGMVTTNRIRLTGLLRKTLANAGVFYIAFRYEIVTVRVGDFDGSQRDHGLAPGGPGLRWVQGSGHFFQGDSSDWWSNDAAFNDRLSQPFQ